MNRETDIHKEFIAWLKKRHIPFVHSRTDKRTTTAIGEPDFYVFWHGHVIGIECKTEKGKLSDAQICRMGYLKQAGVRVEVCHSLDECVAATNTLLDNKNDSGRPWYMLKWPPSLDCQSPTEAGKGKVCSV